VSIPVNSATFGPAEVSAVRAILDDESAAPVLLHCTTANRAAAVWGLTEIQRGRAASEVEAEAAKAGLSHPTTVKGFPPRGGRDRGVPEALAAARAAGERARGRGARVSADELDELMRRRRQRHRASQADERAVAMHGASFRTRISFSAPRARSSAM
jgi:hypothetical protein